MAPTHHHRPFYLPYPMLDHRPPAACPPSVRHVTRSPFFLIYSVLYTLANYFVEEKKMHWFETSLAGAADAADADL